MNGGYKEIRDGFEDWLFEKSKIPWEFIDNLYALIWFWNNESDTFTLIDYINNKGLKIHKDYEKYFRN